MAIHLHSAIADYLPNALTRVMASLGVSFQPQDFSPEADLIGKVMDARLAPRVPMRNDNIDVQTLLALSNEGYKRGKLVTDETHPELMAAWKTMAKRAGLPVAPQLIACDSMAVNAATLDKHTVAMSTALMKSMNLREVVAVLGHELGHAQSNHTKPRVIAYAVNGAVAIAATMAYGKHGGLPRTLGIIAEKWPLLAKPLRWFGARDAGQPLGWLGHGLHAGMFAFIGGGPAKQFSVRPTELDADRKGAAISGDPQGLAQALDRLQMRLEDKPVSKLGQLVMHVRRFMSGYPSTESRIERLRAMPLSSTPVLAELGLPEQVPLPQVAAVLQPESPQRPVMAVHGVQHHSRVDGQAPAASLT